MSQFYIKFLFIFQIISCYLKLENYNHVTILLNFSQFIFTHGKYVNIYRKTIFIFLCTGLVTYLTDPALGIYKTPLLYQQENSCLSI